MDLKISIETNGVVAIVRVVGPVDMANYPDLREKLEEIVDSGVSQIALDMSRVTAIDSSGIGLMLRIAARLAETSGHLSLFALTTGLRKMFDVAKLGLRLRVFETEAQALESYRVQGA